MQPIRPPKIICQEKSEEFSCIKLRTVRKLFLESMKSKIIKDKYQCVVITLSDGTKASFIGQAIAKEPETRKIVNIQFTRPQKMPPGTTFGSIEQ